MSIVVWDIETQSSFRTTCGCTDEEKKKNMQPSVVCATVVTADAMAASAATGTAPDCTRHTFWRDNNSAKDGPFALLLQLFDEATVIVGYNVLAFDFPVMLKFYGKRGGHAAQRYASHIAKTMDPFARLRDAYGIWLPLNELLADNALPAKISCGLEAIRMWEHDKRQDLEEYCAADVDLLLRLVLLPEVRCARLGPEPLSRWAISVRHAVGD